MALSDEYKAVNNKRTIYVRYYQKSINISLVKILLPVLERLKDAAPEIVFYEIDELMQPELIAKEYKSLYNEVCMYFANRTIKAKHNKPAYTKKDNEESVIKEIWQDQINQYYDTDGAVSITEVLNTQKELTKSLLSKTLVQYQEEGLGVESITNKIIQDISDEYGNQAKWRARRIAQTEVLKASNFAMDMSAKSLGYRYTKTWVTGGKSKKERHTLIPGLHGQKVMQDQYFDVDGEKMLYPGDPSGGESARNIINCKCIHVVKLEI